MDENKYKWNKQLCKYSSMALLDTIIKIVVQCIIAYVFTMVLRNIETNTQYHSVNSIIRILLGIIFLYIVDCQFVNIMSKCVTNITGYLYKRVMNEFLNYTVKESENINCGETITLITNEINNIEVALISSLPNSLYTFVLAVAIIIYSLTTGFAIILIILIFILTIWFANGYYMRKGLKNQLKERDALNQYNEFLQATYNSMDTVRTYKKQSTFKNIIGKKNEELKNLSKERGKYLSILTGANNGLFSMCILLSILAGFYLLHDNVEFTTKIVPLIYLEMKIVYRFRKMDEHLSQIQKAVVSYKYLLSFRHTKKEIHKESMLFNSIELKEIEFSYNNSGAILKDFNISIKKGDRIAFIGKNGCGKSTALKVVAGLYEPTKGLYLINKEKVDFEFEQIYAVSSYVQQDYYVNNIKLIDILRICNPSMKDESIKDKAKEYGFHDIFISMKDNYETILGEGGKYISGGQRQLISFFIALLKKPEILFLDESLSAIEHTVKDKVIDCIKKLPRSTTVIISDHDKNMINLADRVYVMKEGRIIDYGTNEELQNNCQEYRKIIDN